MLGDGAYDGIGSDTGARSKEGDAGYPVDWFVEVCTESDHDNVKHLCGR